MNAIEHAYEFLTEARKVPSFATSDDRLNSGGWMIALIGGTHRDCTTLDKANAAEICAQLVEACGGIESIGTTFDYMRASHWAVGWYEHLIVDPSDERVMKVIAECGCALADYPVLSEQRLSEMEIVAHDDGECGEDCEIGPHCPKCHGPALDHGFCERHEPEFKIGCYGDGAFGHQHTRERCAAVVEAVARRLSHPGEVQTGIELVAELRGDMSDDGQEEYDACEWLDDNTDTPDNANWGWEDGDFGLWRSDEG